MSDYFFARDQINASLIRLHEETAALIEMGFEEEALQLASICQSLTYARTDIYPPETAKITMKSSTFRKGA